MRVHDADWVNVYFLCALAKTEHVQQKSEHVQP